MRLKSRRKDRCLTYLGRAAVLCPQPFRAKECQLRTHAAQQTDIPYLRHCRPLSAYRKRSSCSNAGVIIRRRLIQSPHLSGLVGCASGGSVFRRSVSAALTEGQRPLIALLRVQLFAIERSFKCSR